MNFLINNFLKYIFIKNIQNHNQSKNLKINIKYHVKKLFIYLVSK